jgi:hypothetical protein
MNDRRLLLLDPQLVRHREHPCSSLPGEPIPNTRRMGSAGLLKIRSSSDPEEKIKSIYYLCQSDDTVEPRGWSGSGPMAQTEVPDIE